LNEIYCYYNEQNVNEESNDNNYPLKILLTGLRLSGKSTFVNLFFNKLLAFVTNDTESGTLKISEYNIKDNFNQNKIKLIDTPGISSKKKKNEILNEINKYIKEEKLDFIFFFYNEGNFLGEGKSLLKQLDKSQIPVFIIINKSKKREKNTKNQDIKSKLIYLKQIGCQRLSNEEYFIEVNLKSNSNEDFFGMESIFDKMEKFEKNKINIDNKIIKNNNEKNKGDNILEIINYYKNKKDWDKDEVEIIRKEKDNIN
jgi:GTP-binding protein EngB required for normal cell division